MVWCIVVVWSGVQGEPVARTTGSPSIRAGAGAGVGLRSRRLEERGWPKGIQGYQES